MTFCARSRTRANAPVNRRRMRVSRTTKFASGRSGTTLAISGGMMPPRTILAATDFSAASISALAYAARLASYCRATLHVVHVEGPSPGAAPGHSAIDLSDRTRREFQRVIAAAAPDAGCSLYVHAMTGPPADVILEVARARRADVVVVGSQRISDAQKPGFGSTTDELLRRAHLSVIVVPAGWKPPRPANVQLPREVKPIHQRTAASLKAGQEREPLDAHAARLRRGPHGIEHQGRPCAPAGAGENGSPLLQRRTHRTGLSHGVARECSGRDVYGLAGQPFRSSPASTSFKSTASTSPRETPRRVVRGTSAPPAASSCGPSSGCASAASAGP